MTDVKDGIKFDPGFGPYVLAFSVTIDYIYQDINKFNNMSQKKVKFMQYYKKILEIFYNNIGFYTGCLMWASCIKALDTAELIGNSCLGESYNPEENVYDTQRIMKFTEQFPRDMKYFLGQNFEFDKKIYDLIKVYEEFLVLNKGFTETKTNSDVILPQEVKTTNLEEYKNLIEKSINEGNLAILADHIDKII